MVFFRLDSEVQRDTHALPRRRGLSVVGLGDSYGRPLGLVDTLIANWVRSNLPSPLTRTLNAQTLSTTFRATVCPASLVQQATQRKPFLRDVLLSVMLARAVLSTSSDWL